MRVGDYVLLSIPSKIESMSKSHDESILELSVRFGFPVHARTFSIILAFLTTAGTDRLASTVVPITVNTPAPLPPIARLLA